MTKRIMFSLAFAIVPLLVATVAEAHDSEHQEQMMVALKTDDVDLAETDISDLAIGDALTVYTENDRTIDILRTRDGIEIYVDGERVDVGPTSSLAPHDGQHVVVTRNVEVICDPEEDCDELTWIEDGDVNTDAAPDAIHKDKVIVIKRESDSD